jgi:MoaA/NifB/PqqE/SkfB family radical SAM enzyme
MVEAMQVDERALTHKPSGSYDLVGFIFTNRCNFACRHCCNESDSHKVAALDLAEIVRGIDEASQCPGVHEIGISGGEPFLFQATLSAVIRHAASRGMPTQVTTNAFWARTPAKAQELLSGLYRDGLRALNISTSRYHLEFIKPERLQFAARAAVEVGLRTRVNYVTSRTFHLEDSSALFGPLADQLEFLPMPCIPTGRAADQVVVDDLEMRASLPLGSCERFFKSLAIDYDGNAFPCCSPGGFTDPLKLGNIREQSVGSILAGLDQNLLIQILRSLGPTYFAPFIVDRLGESALDQHFVDQCHFCHTVMSDPMTAEVVREVVQQLEHDLQLLQWDLTALLEHAATVPVATQTSVGLMSPS